MPPGNASAARLVRVSPGAQTCYIADQGKLAASRIASACKANLLASGFRLRLACPAAVSRRGVLVMAQQSELATRRDKAAGAGERRPGAAAAACYRKGSRLQLIHD